VERSTCSPQLGERGASVSETPETSAPRGRTSTHTSAGASWMHRRGIFRGSQGHGTGRRCGHKGVGKVASTPASGCTPNPALGLANWRLGRGRLGWVGTPRTTSTPVPGATSTSPSWMRGGSPRSSVVRRTEAACLSRPHLTEARIPIQGSQGLPSSGWNACPRHLGSTSPLGSRQQGPRPQEAGEGLHVGYGRLILVIPKSR